MTREFTRRETLHYAAASAAALVGGGLLPGCTSGRGGEEAPWWLQGNYAPVSKERDAVDLAVEGTIPPELDGVYIRNGPNPPSGESGHWFVGEGMLHGVRLQGGAARWYRNRYVQTELLTDPPLLGIGPPSLTSHPANTALVIHADRVLALAETGLPYEIDRELGTRGWHDYDGKLKTAMTAHPKVDPRTGEMLFFGYGFQNYLTYHRVDAAGVLQQSEAIELPEFSMMHDFAVSEKHVVFIDVPVGLDLTLLASGIPLGWKDDHPTRFGVMPRGGGADDVKWIEIEQCMIVHTMNAHDTPDGKIVMEAARIPHLWRGGASNWETGSLWRFTIDPVAGTVQEQQLDDHICDFPQIDQTLLGRKNRYGYAAHFGLDAPGNQLKGVNGALKFDLEAGTTELLELPVGETTDEVYFAQAKGGTAEDHGYLIGFGHDAKSNRSNLGIYDAQKMKRIARIEIPVRVPAGFHGMWVPT